MIAMALSLRSVSAFPDESLATSSVDLHASKIFFPSSISDVLSSIVI